MKSRMLVVLLLGLVLVFPASAEDATPVTSTASATSYDFGAGWVATGSQQGDLGDMEKGGVVETQTTTYAGPNYSFIRVIEAQLSVLNAQEFYEARTMDLDYFAFTLSPPSGTPSVTPNGCAISRSVQGTESLTGIAIGSTNCVTDNGRYLWVSLAGGWDDPRTSDPTLERFSEATSNLIETILGLPVTPRQKASSTPTSTTSSTIVATAPDSNYFGATPTRRGFPLPNNGDVASGCWTDAQRTTDGSQTLQWSAAPAMVIDPDQIYTAELVTNFGTMVWQLLPEASAVAVNNFVCLTRAGYYEGAPFHRVVDNFVIQGGDPTGTGLGGPGYTLVDSPVVGDYSTGMVTMARTARPNSTGSQFFINIADNTDELGPSAAYINFARVIMEDSTIAEILSIRRVQGQDGAISSPVEPVILQSVTIYEAGVPPFLALP